MAVRLARTVSPGLARTTWGHNHDKAVGKKKRKGLYEKDVTAQCRRLSNVCVQCAETMHTCNLKTEESRCDKMNYEWSTLHYLELCQGRGPISTRNPVFM